MRRTALVALLLPIVVAGCIEGGRAIHISNDLDEAVLMYYGNLSKPVSEIGAHESIGGDKQLGLAWDDPTRECTTQDIVFTTTDRSRAWRIPAPACLDEAYSLSNAESIPPP